MGRRQRYQSDVHGSLLVDKTAGCTSHDVVVKIREALGTSRVGHSGTLDPDATGLLIVGVGFGTKLLEYSVGLNKSYVADVKFGVETSTLDDSGDVTATHGMDFTLEDLVATSGAFMGQIQQVPPMVSAIKVGGKRLHQFAREGVEVERTARPVTISALEWEPTPDPDCYQMSVSCSSGTFVRSLAADIGTALGGGAHLIGLRRTSVGSHDVASAIEVNEVSPDSLGGLDVLLGEVEIVDLSAQNADAVAHGRQIESDDIEGTVAFKAPDGRIVAIYESVSGQLRAKKVAPWFSA